MYKSKTDILSRLVALSVFVLVACTPAQPPATPTALALPPTAYLHTPETPLPAETASLSPTAISTATSPACSPARLDSGSVGQGLLDKPMDYHVLLPPCYAEQPDRRYPVLYLLHGQNFTQDQWLNLGAAEHAERLMRSGDIPAYLIVLPFDHSFKQPREYKFEQVFVEQLVARVDETYRTLSQPAARAIGGLSRGGAWAIYLASRHPDLFGVVGAHSPAIFYSNNSALPVRLRDIPLEQRPVFYVDAGDKDVDFREIQRFTALLNQLGYAHEWHYNLGFHDEKYWSGHAKEYLLWYGAQFMGIP